MRAKKAPSYFLWFLSDLPVPTKVLMKFVVNFFQESFQACVQYDHNVSYVRQFVVICLICLPTASRQHREHLVIRSQYPAV